MKKLIFGLIATVLFGNLSFGQEGTKIGILKDDNCIITIDIDLLRVEWQSILTSQKNNEKLIKFEIEKDVIENSKDEYYLLVAENEKGDFKNSVRLILKDSTFYLLYENLAMDSCTCSGCTKGCSPRLTRSPDGEIEWYCTSCRVKDGGCSKSVSTNINK